MNRYRVAILCAGSLILATALVVGDRGVREYKGTFVAPGHLGPWPRVMVLAQAGTSPSRPYLPISLQTVQAAIPAVSSLATLARVIPVDNSFTLNSQTFRSPTALVDGAFFDVTRLPLLAGRQPALHGGASDECLLVDAMAGKLAAGGVTPIGARITTMLGTCTVVGVSAANSVNYWAPNAVLLMLLTGGEVTDARANSRSAASIVTLLMSMRDPANEYAAMAAAISGVAPPSGAKLIAVSASSYLFTPAVLATARAAAVAGAIAIAVGLVAVMTLLLLDGAIMQREMAIQCAVGASPLPYLWYSVRRDARRVWLPAIAVGALVSVVLLQNALISGASFIWLTTVTVSIPTLGVLAAALRCVWIRRVGVNGVVPTANRRVIVGCVIGLQCAGTVLLVCAGAYVGSYRRLVSTPLGVDLDTVTVSELETRELVPSATIRPVVEAIASAPSRDALSFSLSHPLADRGFTETVSIDGIGQFLNGRRRDGKRVVTPGKKIVGPNYAGVVGARISAGRDISWNDTAAVRRIAVVNERMARTYWGEQSPLGARIKFVPTRDESEPWAEVVGVISDVQHEGFRSAVKPEAYVSILQEESFSGVLYVIVSGRAPVAATSLEALSTVSAPFEPKRAAPLRSEAEKTVGMLKGTSVTMMTAAAIACGAQLISLMLATWTALRQRRREVALRLALGASLARAVGPLWRVLAIRAALGTVVGIPAGLGLARWLSRFDADLLSVPVLGMSAAAVASAASVVVSFGMAVLTARHRDTASVLREL